MHHVFTEMYSTVSIGDRHTWNIPRNLHIFPYCTPPDNNSQKKLIQFQRCPTLPVFPEAGPIDIWTRFLVTNFLSFNLVSTSQITISNFADHHKKYLSLLALTSNHKINHLRSARDYKFHAFTIQVQPPHLTSKAYPQFSTVRRRSKEYHSIFWSV